jgi:hypothetical protein
MRSLPWLLYFQDNRTPSPHPWDDPYRLTPAERETVSASVQQFQLGEGSDGSSFFSRGAELAADPDFLPSLRLFVAEEQRHSAELGRFLDREGIPRLARHWVDQVFRRLRKLAGLEVMVRVLVTAEIIALPYYRALREATRSPLLRSICSRILSDEDAHLRYQAATLLRLGRRRWVDVAHRWLLYATLLVVWKEHRRVFRAGKYRFSRVACEALDALDEVLLREAQPAARLAERWLR